MKLIKKPAKKIVKSLVGDVVHLELSYNDGRVIESYVVKASVVKVNRVTFDAKTENGNVYAFGYNFNGALGLEIYQIATPTLIPNFPKRTLCKAYRICQAGVPAAPGISSGKADFFCVLALSAFRSEGGDSRARPLPRRRPSQWTCFFSCGWSTLSSKFAQHF